MYMYACVTQYISYQVSQVLNSLEVFFHEVEPEVERMGEEGGSGLSLMALMAIFNKVHGHMVVCGCDCQSVPTCVAHFTYMYTLVPSYSTTLNPFPLCVLGECSASGDGQEVWGSTQSICNVGQVFSPSSPEAPRAVQLCSSQVSTN